MSLQLRSYGKTSQTEVIGFVLAHSWLVPWSAPLLVRFFCDLTSSSDMIFDFFQDSERAAVAVLLDEVKNPGNEANLEILAIAPSIDPEQVYIQALALAKERLSPKRDAFAFGFAESFSLGPAIAERQGCTPHYEMCDMLCADPAAHARVDSEIELRRPEHAREAYDVLMTTFQHNPDTSLPSFEGFQKAVDRDQTLRSWILRVEGKIVGFVTTVRDGTTMEIKVLGVLPEYRGRGYARRLLAHALAQVSAQRADRCKLSVAVKNQKALGLYKSLGFEPRERHLVFRWVRA